jgi:hypothetical protein
MKAKKEKEIRVRIGVVDERRIARLIRYYESTVSGTIRILIMNADQELQKKEREYGK